MDRNFWLTISPFRQLLVAKKISTHYILLLTPFCIGRLHVRLTEISETSPTIVVVMTCYAILWCLFVRMQMPEIITYLLTIINNDEVEELERKYVPKILWR